MLQSVKSKKAEEWAKGLKANLARKPQGNDRAQVKAIFAGECDISLGNSSYMGKVLTDKKKIAWTESVFVVFPNQMTRGAHMNISGTGITKHTGPEGNAVKLLEFLSDDLAQKMYAEQNFEYPVKPVCPGPTWWSRGAGSRPTASTWSRSPRTGRRPSRASTAWAFFRPESIDGRTEPMKLGRLIWTGVAVLVLSKPALAQQSVEDRLSGMEKRIQNLEQRVADQDEMIVEKDRQIAELTGQTKWAQGLEISGVIEIEAAYDKRAGEESTNSVDVDTAEVETAAEVNDWTSAELALAYDADAGKVEVDTATVTLGPPDGPWSLTAGKLTLPFGTFETGMISDPVTLELGETGDVATVFEVSSGGLSVSLFGLHGESEEFENFGMSVGYSVGTGTWPSALDLSVSYINEIRSDSVADSEAFSELPGMAASATVGSGHASLTVEYVKALDEQSGSEPSAWMVEGRFKFEFLGKRAAVAAGYQATHEAADLELPERRMLLGLAVELTEGVGLSMEWKQDEAYGSDDRDTTITVVLALKF